MPRRSTILAVVAALVLSTFALPAAADVGSTACPDGAPPAGFADVPAGGAHAPAIDCAVELGIIQGTTPTTFSPARAVTRGQVASLVVRTLEDLGLVLPPLAGAPDFDDLTPTHAGNIRRLAATDIVRGLGDGSFGPDDAVTREQFASIVIRALGYVRAGEVTPAGEPPFGDVGDGVHAANIAAAAEAGLIRGRQDGTFDPRASTRRDQAASIIVRLRDLAPADVVGEVWSLDQGTDRIHIYAADTREELVTIDVSPSALADAGFENAPAGASTVPHMIEFDSQERFAFIASTAGAVTIVVDARSKQVVEVLATGAGTHMAAVAPDDSAVWVAAIGAQRMVEIPLELTADEPTFAIGRELAVSELLAPIEAANDWDFPSYSPVCHQYSPDSSEAWVTLGPGWNQGGFFVLDLASGEVTHAWDPEVVKANCGVSVTDERVLANWSGRVVSGDDSNGEWYVLDPATKELLDTRDTEGFDAHGLRLTPDGTAYWQVNRASDNALVIDAQSLEVTARYSDIADTPDIIDYSPDGSLIYITQRGPNPRSGAIHAATGDQPGVAVVDTSTGETIEVLEPPTVTDTEGLVLNDVHGIGVRVRGTGGAAQAISAAATDAEPLPTVVPVRDEPANLGFHCGIPAA
jgi:DNA-binding beta-propeller fold protein YncE